MKCIPQKISKFILGLVLLVGAIGFIGLGFTLFPFIGFFVAIPFVVLAVYFFKVHLNSQCEIDFSTD